MRIEADIAGIAVEIVAAIEGGMEAEIEAGIAGRHGMGAADAEVIGAEIGEGGGRIEALPA